MTGHAQVFTLPSPAMFYRCKEARSSVDQGKGEVLTLDNHSLLKEQKESKRPNHHHLLLLLLVMDYITRNLLYIQWDKEAYQEAYRTAVQ